MKVVRHTLLIFCMLLIGALAASKAYSQSIVIKNNLLYDATLTPNLEAEVKIGQRQTAGLILGFNPFPLKDEFSYDGDNKKMRHLLVAPMWRYWFCEAFAGHFVSCNVAYVHYNVSNKKFPFGLFKGVDKERRQGDLVAAGASYGYSWILSPRWSLEAEAGADVGYAWSKRYKYHHCGMFIGNENHLVVLPKVGVNIIYNVK